MLISIHFAYERKPVSYLDVAIQDLHQAITRNCVNNLAQSDMR